WGGMLIGRLFGAMMLRSLKPQTVLTGSAILATLLILISINSGGYIAVWSMVAVGLCNSIMFAVIFSLSVKGLGKYTTRASGLLSTAIVGGAVISYSQGLVKDYSTWSVAYIIPLICYIYILFYGLNGYRSKRISMLSKRGSDD